MLDKARLPAARWAFENHGQARRVRSFKQTDFVIDGEIIRLVGDFVFFYCSFCPARSGRRFSVEKLANEISFFGTVRLADSPVDQVRLWERILVGIFEFAY